MTRPNYSLGEHVANELLDLRFLEIRVPVGPYVDWCCSRKQRDSVVMVPAWRKTGGVSEDIFEFRKNILKTIGEDDRYIGSKFRIQIVINGFNR